VVLISDANVDLSNPTDMLMVTSMGIHNVVAPFKEGKLHFSTYNRGSMILDGCFAIGDVHMRRGGHIPFGKGLPSDHQRAWIGIEIGHLPDNYMEPIHHVNVIHLKFNHPQARKK
jgi:hypothetical protein